MFFMKASVEISMYPLTENYGTAILTFLDKLKRYPSIEMHSNTMSTQLFGNYDEIMEALTKEIKESFRNGNDSVIVFKIANLDLRP